MATKPSLHGSMTGSAGPHHCGLDRRVEVLPLAGAVALVQRTNDVSGRLHRTEVYRLREADGDRRTVAVALHVEQTACRRKGEIRGGLPGRRAGLSERRHRDVEQRRVLRAQRGVAEPAALHLARCERFDEDVRAPYQCQELVTIGLRIDVEHDAALAEAPRLPEERALRVALGPHGQRRREA
jgi:hypothetical protein